MDQEDKLDLANMPCSPGYRRCPFCKKEIPANAEKCEKCGKTVAESVSGEGAVYQEEPTWLEAQFIKTTTLSVMLVAFFAAPFGLAIAIYGLVKCRHPQARA